MDDVKEHVTIKITKSGLSFLFSYFYFYFSIFRTLGLGLE